MKNVYCLFLLIVLNISTVFSQNKSFTIDEILSDDFQYSMTSVDTISKNPDYGFWITLDKVLEEKGFPRDSNGRVVINKQIELSGFWAGWNDIENIVFEKTVVINVSLENGTYPFTNCIFKDDFLLNVKGDESPSIYLLDCEFYGDVKIRSGSIIFGRNTSYPKLESYKGVSALSNRMGALLKQKGADYIDSIKSKATNTYGENALPYKVNFYFDASKSINLAYNIFKSDPLIILSGSVEEIRLDENNIEGILDLSRLVVSDKLTFNENYLVGNMDISETVFPEQYNSIIWDKKSDFSLVARYEDFLKLPDSIPNSISRVQQDSKGKNYVMTDFYYQAKTDSAIRDNLIYRLKASYQKLSEIYKTTADQEAANWAYAQKMTLEGKRLGEEYKDDKNFRTFFRWQLNNLMRVYTNHGTDPGLALTISLYVVLFFAVIYFFFPSEWDVSSKSKLLSDFKDFTAKNDKGYFFPFLNVLGGLTISLINALTLSLNSFTTLGFGNIPTKGLARYLTIIQGFVGWFLLGLFSVSLINQVLA